MKDIPPCYYDEEVRRRLRGWFAKPLGQSLLAAERSQIEHILPKLFGSHAAQVGALGEGINLLAGAHLAHAFVADPDRQAGPGLAVLCARPDALPIESDSLGAVVLPHTLEFELDPHQVLREAERVVFPEGHVIITGFNPWSLWGLWRQVCGRRGDVPWCGRFLSQMRIRDWLALLGFEVVLVRNFFFRPPLRHQALMRRLSFLERAGERGWPLRGGAYLLVAKKKVIRLTPISPRWRSRRRLVPGRLLEPSRRDRHRDQCS
jgi:SAM-dependent methyltransferase